MIRQYFRAQWREIQESLELRALGVGLAVVHIATWKYWLGSGQFLYLSRENQNPLCWPFLQGCEAWKVLSLDQINSLAFGYLLLAHVTAVLYLFRTAVPWAWALLAALNVIKLAIFWQDYRMMGNYHFMAFLVSGVFLFLPEKSRAVRMLIAGLYISAGTIKLNHEWLSGAAIPSFELRPGTLPFWAKQVGLLPPLCAYTVLLEMVAVFGLFSSSPWIFWGTFAQFVLFHIFSYWIVGWFFPATMVCILVIFPFHFIITRNRHAPWPGLSSWMQQAPALVLLFFALFQLYPKLLPGDEALTSEGRMFALNMFDSLPVCYSKSIAHFRDKSIDISLTSREVSRGVRIQCDPYAYFTYAKFWCKKFRNEPGFLGIDLSLISRRTSDAAFKEIVAESDFCRDDLTYSSWLPNRWIRK